MKNKFALAFSVIWMSILIWVLSSSSKAGNPANPYIVIPLIFAILLFISLILINFKYKRDNLCVTAGYYSLLVGIAVFIIGVIIGIFMMLMPQQSWGDGGSFFPPYFVVFIFTAAGLALCVIVSSISYTLSLFLKKS